jgi:hypothetical protein
MKYRPTKIKLKHGLISGLRRHLESIEDWPEITAINPGVIRPTKGSGGLKLTVQYETKAGLKVLAKSGAAVQEVFFVTSNPQRLAQRIKELHPE